MRFLGPSIAGVINLKEAVAIQEHRSSCIIETKYVNLSNMYLLLCFRDGTYIMLPPHPTKTSYNMLVVGHVKRSSDNGINIIDGEECELNNHLKLQLLPGRNHLYWEEFIGLDKILEHRNGIYLTNSDAIAVSANRLDRVPYHPFCKQGTLNTYLNQIDDIDPNKDISIAIRLVNNNGVMDPIYTVFDKKIMVINPRQSNTLEDGLYITGMSSLFTQNTNNIRKATKYTLEQLERNEVPIPIFTSLTDANKFVKGEENIIRTEEHERFIAELKVERERLEVEHALLKVNLTQQRTDADRREAEYMAAAAREKIEMEKEMLKIKEETSAKIAETKQSTETIKLLVGGIGLVVTLWKIFG